MLAKHQEETSWLATRHLVPRCYYADKSQLSPALSSSVQLSPAQSSSVLHCFVLCLTFVLNLMYFMCVFNINLCFSPYCLGYSYIFITVSHFISSWKKISVLHWKLILIFVISMFVIITLVAVIKDIEILLHFKVQAVGYCQQDNTDISSDHR